MRDFYQWLDKHELLLQKLAVPYAEAGYLYILQLDPREDILEKLSEKLSIKQKQTLMSAAQRLIDRGIQQGMQQGMQTEKLTIAKNMLFQLQLDVDTVQKATELDKMTLEKLLKEGQ